MVSDKVSTTKSYDAQGNLLSVTDPAGTIVYNLAADGQPSSVTAPGNIVTSFGYDKYRRQTSLIDPSQGTTTYEYDAAGNVAKETNANGKVTQNEYDSYNRLIKTTTPEFVTSFTYNSKDELTNISTNNGTSKSFAYDNYGKLITWKEMGWMVNGCKRIIPIQMEMLAPSNTRHNPVCWLLKLSLFKRAFE